MTITELKPFEFEISDLPEDKKKLKAFKDPRFSCPIHGDDVYLVPVEGAHGDIYRCANYTHDVEYEQE